MFIHNTCEKLISVHFSAGVKFWGLDISRVKLGIGIFLVKFNGSLAERPSIVSGSRLIPPPDNVIPRKTDGPSPLLGPTSRGVARPVISYRSAIEADLGGTLGGRLMVVCLLNSS